VGGYYEPQSKQSVGKKSPSSGSTVQAVASDPVIMPAETFPTSNSANNTTPVSSWLWPVNGKIIDNFSLSDGGNKGIDVAGTRGQPILATADGRVVYAGNALRGYGNLIIIKHNDDYLSAYAHNDTMLVREQQQVTAGQKIATMGSTGTSSARLHFEIRYKGKSVNPLRYLPQR
jgi:lipoprotein NlpD